MTFDLSASQRRRAFEPETFGRYTLLMPLAAGGMGEVFLARTTGARGFRKFVIIKKIVAQLAGEPEFVSRFVDEAKIVVDLHHGSIAQVLDMGVIDDEYYIAMEYVDGKDLRRILQRTRERGERLPIGIGLFAVVRVLDALAYAHRKKGGDGKALGVVHRDISPQNVLVSYEGEVKVIDFGLAKTKLSLARTNPAAVIGKFFYMSPEQARHQPVDRRADLYAAGVVLWEVLAGRNPYEGVSPADVMPLVADPRIPSLADVAPSVPKAVCEVVNQALEINPDNRFQNAEAMRNRLMSAMLDIDANVGPEVLASFMGEYFVKEHRAERRIMESLEGDEPAPDGVLEGDTTGPQSHHEAKTQVSQVPEEALVPGTSESAQGAGPAQQNEVPNLHPEVNEAPTPPATGIDAVGGGPSEPSLGDLPAPAPTELPITVPQQAVQPAEAGPPTSLQPVPEPPVEAWWRWPATLGVIGLVGLCGAYAVASQLFAQTRVGDRDMAEPETARPVAAIPKPPTPEPPKDTMPPEPEALPEQNPSTPAASLESAPPTPLPVPAASHAPARPPPGRPARAAAAPGSASAHPTEPVVREPEPPAQKKKLMLMKKEIDDFCRKYRDKRPLLCEDAKPELDQHFKRKIDLPEEYPVLRDELVEFKTRLGL